MENLAKRLKIDIDCSNKYWQLAYKKALLEPQVPHFISEEFVEKMQEEYGILPQNYMALRSAVRLIKQEKDLCLLAKILYHLLFLDIEKDQIFQGFCFDGALNQGQNSLQNDLFLVFPILAHMPFAYDVLAKKGVDRSVIISSLSQLDKVITEATEQEKRPCFPTTFFLYYKSFIYLKTLKIGRLRFEIAPKSYGNFMVLEDKFGGKKVLVNDIVLHKSGNALGNLGFVEKEQSVSAKIVETDEFVEGFAVDEKTYLANTFPTKFDKKDWKVIYRPTDDVVIVHIPPNGCFDRETIVKSYQKARQIFKQCYTEYDFKGFVTDTWLFAPALDQILSENSNIKAFRKDYIIFPAKCTGLDIFEYVFGIFPKTIDDVDIDNLPEDNSLKKGVKKLLKQGVYFHEFYGFYKF